MIKFNVESIAKLPEEEQQRILDIIKDRKRAGNSSKLHDFRSDIVKQGYIDKVVSWYGVTPTELWEVEKYMLDDEQRILDNTSDSNERQKVKEDLRKQRFNALDQFAKANYEDEEFFTNAVGAFDKLKETAAKGKQDRTDREVLYKQLVKQANQANTEYHEGLDKVIKDCQRWFKDYAKAFNDFDYQEPQQEMLKRQDFDTKLAGLDAGGLTDFIQDEMPSANLTPYQANKLLAVVKASGDKQNYDTVKRFIKNQHIGKEYETTSAYKAVVKKLSKANSMKYVAGDNILVGSYVQNIKDLPDQLIKGYQVSDPAQRQAAGLR